MDRSTPTGGNASLDSTTKSASATPIANVEGAAHSAHRTVDKVADQATSQVDRLSGTAHRAVNTAADAATSAAEWASGIPDQAAEVHAQVTEALCASIRARPIATVASALVVGYLLGRIARL